MADCGSVCVSSFNLISFLCKEIWEDAKHICQRRAVICIGPEKKRNKKYFSTSWFTHSWPPHRPHCPPAIVWFASGCLATCLHQSLDITWHCLSCSSLGNKCKFFMFFWAKKQLERNKSVTSSFKPLMSSLTELSVCVFTSFFWTGKFPRECVSVWVLFGINLFSRERSEEDVL